MTLRVLLDATAIPTDRGGVGRYVEGLVQGLQSTDVSLVVAAQSRDAARFAALGPHAEVVVAPALTGRRAARFAWEQTGLPALVARTRADVLHSPHYTRPLLRAGAASVVTLHDATFFSDPGVHTRAKRALFRAETRAAVRAADALVVPSAATRDEVVRWAGGDPQRFVVAHHGVDRTVFRPPSDSEVLELRTRLGLGDGPFIAFLGTLEPRKNVPALLRAWLQVAETAGAPALVLAGARGWDDEIAALERTVPAGAHLVVPGYLALDHLRALLGGATIVAYPSLGEGFGLPVLEAMACGAVVLTTRRLSLPEVGGDAVAYTEVDPQSIAEALAGLLGDPAGRAELGLRAGRRSARFTWEASAQAHVTAYRMAAARRSRRVR